MCKFARKIAKQNSVNLHLVNLLFLDGVFDILVIGYETWNSDCNWDPAYFYFGFNRMTYLVLGVA